MGIYEGGSAKFDWLTHAEKLADNKVISRAHSFPRAAEFRAKPGNMPFSVEL